MAFQTPAVQKFTVITVQIARSAYDDSAVVFLEVPAALLSALQIECQTVMLPEIFQGFRCAVFFKVFWRCADDAMIGAEFDGDQPRVRPFGTIDLFRSFRCRF